MTETVRIETRTRTRVAARRWSVAAFAAALATGCTTMVAPVYVPQTLSRLSGRGELGTFSYLPSADGGFDADELDDSAIGTIRLTEDVATFVKRATAAELEKAGVALDEGAPLLVSGEVEYFKVGTAGYTVEWKIRIRYQLLRANDRSVVVDKRVEAEISHGKFVTPELSNIPTALVAKCIEQLLSSADVRAAFRSQQGQASAGA